MTRPVIVFLGPSLSVEEARSILEAWYLPPARAGDVLAALRLRPRAIGLIDGLFDRVAGVWHKELLHALERGVIVAGAASMGALRAAELAPFGMAGIGEIFKKYRSGEYRDDDEVALLHGDESLGFRCVTEPMVNVRATVARAVREGALTTTRARGLLSSAKELPYGKRRWDALLDGPGLEGFRRFLVAGGRVDQKAADARALLRHLSTSKQMPPSRRPSILRTLYFRYLEQEVAASPFRVDRDWLPPAERAARAAAELPYSRMLRLLVRLLNMVQGPIRASRAERQRAEEMLRLTESEAFGAAPPRLRTRLTAVCAALDRSLRREGMEPPAEEFQRWVDAFRRERGLVLRSRTLAWLRRRRLSRARFGELLAFSYRLRFLLKNPPADTPRPRLGLADGLRLCGGP